MIVDKERMINFKLSLEGLFILDCLYNEDSETITNYVNNVNLIPEQVFLNLIKDGWLTSTGTRYFTLKNIEITEKYQVEYLAIPITKNITFDDAFVQLRLAFPKIAGTSGRRLQSNIDKCKVLYKKAIFSTGHLDEELHNKILQCIKYEIKIRTTSRNLEYFQLLPTWLGQKTWEIYLEEIDVKLEKGESITPASSSDGKTIIGKTEF